MDKKRIATFVFKEDKKRLAELRDKLGLPSIAVLVEKLINEKLKEK